MMSEDIPDYDDLADALREGRALRPARAYRIRFALGNLNFRDLDVEDPVPYANSDRSGNRTEEIAVGRGRTQAGCRCARA